MPAWADLSAADLSLLPFSTRAFAEAVLQALPLRCTWHEVLENDQVLAALPVFHRKRGPIRETVIPPFTAYTPPLLRSPLEEHAIHARRHPLIPLLESLEERYHVIRLHLHPGQTDVRPFLWRGWRASPFYTYSLPVEEEGLMVKAYSSATRRTTRKYAEAFTFKEHAPSYPLAVECCVTSYQRQGRRLPLSVQALHLLVAGALNAGLARTFFAYENGNAKPAAALVILQQGETACYWVAGSEPGPSMTMLVHHVLSVLMKDGVRRFDFIGANTPTIAEFKRRFGARLTPFFRVEHIASPMLRACQALRRP